MTGTIPVDGPLAAPASWRSAWATLRGAQWRHFALLPLAALSGTGASALGRMARGVAVASLALAYAYGLNAITDRATDRDARKNPLAGRSSCPATAATVVAGMALLALALAATNGRSALLAAAISIAAATAYSAGPQLKRWPGVGMLANAAIFTPLLFVGRATAGVPAQMGLLTTAFIALLIQSQLLHECADIDEDAARGAWTTARALGLGRTTTAALLTGIAGAFACVPPAPSRALALIAAAVLIGTGAFAMQSSLPFARRRAAHRAIGLAGGALLWAAALARGGH